MAGNFGSDIAFWVDDDISVSGDNGAGGLGDGYLKFVDVSRFLKLPKYSLSFRSGPIRTGSAVHAGTQHQYQPVRHLHRRATSARSTPAVPLQQICEQHSSPSPGRKGIEFSGGRTLAAITIQWPSSIRIPAASAQSSNASAYVRPLPEATRRGGRSPRTPASRTYTPPSLTGSTWSGTRKPHAIQAAGPTGPRDHTFLNLGSFYLYGSSVQRLLGATPAEPQPLYCARAFLPRGADFNFNYPHVCSSFGAVHVRARYTTCCRWIPAAAHPVAGVLRPPCRWVLLPACPPSSTAASCRPTSWPIRG